MYKYHYTSIGFTNVNLILVNKEINISEALVVMWLRHRLPDPKVVSSITGDCTSQLTSYNFFSLFSFHKFKILSSACTI